MRRKETMIIKKRLPYNRNFFDNLTATETVYALADHDYTVRRKSIFHSSIDPSTMVLVHFLWNLRSAIWAGEFQFVI
jgi:hypothetical protein